MIDTESQIDAVVTWVDGSDESHRSKKRKVLNQVPSGKKNELTTARDKTRFIDNGELKFCISSIRKFAPWIRKIHLVTDNQVPGFITPKVLKQYNISIVDHKEIFKSYEWALPTFNTRTIETALFRIPGLAPRFIYFNDDFVITDKITPGDFFLDEKLILKGVWKRMSRYGPIRMKINNLASYFAKQFLGITRSMHLLQQIRSAQLAGFEKKYFRIPHIPHPVRTETLRIFFEENPEFFERNIKYRFRSTDQFSAIFLANHLEIKNNSAILKKPDDFLMINGEMNFLPVLERKLNRIKNNEVRFICLQGLEMFKKAHLKKIKKTLKKDVGLKKLKAKKKLEMNIKNESQQE